MVRLFAGLMLLASEAVLACSVCGFGEDERTAMFGLTTLILSAVPLGMLGGLAYLLYRLAKKNESN